MRRLLLAALVGLCLCASASAQVISQFGSLAGTNSWTGTNRFSNGITLGPISFASLSSYTGLGLAIIVNDATAGSSPCVGGGTGALAIYINGAWNCAGNGSAGVTGATVFGGLTLSNGGTTLGLITTCAANQVLQFNSGTWNCATVAGTGTVTGATTNGGLVTGNGGTTLGMLTSCATNQILLFNGTAWICSSAITGGVITAPASSQNIVQPVPTTFSANSLANILYVTPTWNWSQTVSTNLATPGSNTITLTPCPPGINPGQSAQPYYVYIPTTNAKAELVTGGTCTIAGSSSGTIIVTTTVAHSASSNVIQSAYAGIQEALNVAEVQSGTSVTTPNAHIVIPPIGANTNFYPIYAPIYMQNKRSLLEGYGAVLGCYTRLACLFLGDNISSTHFENMRVEGLRFVSETNVDGVQVTSASVTSDVVTLTAASHPFVIGDVVGLNVSIPTYGSFHGFWTVTGTTTNTFSFAATKTNLSATAAFGTAAIEAAAIEDAGQSDVMRDINFADFAEPNFFNNAIVVDNDQAAEIRHVDTESGAPVRHDINWVGWIIWSRGDNGNSAVVTIDGGSNIAASCANGVRNGSGNFMTIRDTVIQDYSQHGIFQGAGLQGGLYDGVYEEVDCTNPAYPGTIYSAAGLVNQGQPATVRGGTNLAGFSPQFACTAGSSTQRNYYIVAHVGANYSIPLFAGSASSLCGAGNVSVYWPQMPQTNPAIDTALATYDLLLATSNTQVPNGTGNYAIATGLTVSGACTNGICGFTDTEASATSYTVGIDPTLVPELDDWPGNYVSSPSTDTENTLAIPLLFQDQISGSSAAPYITASSAPAIYAHACAANRAYPSIALMQCDPPNSSVARFFIDGNPFPQGGGSHTSTLQGSLIFSGALAPPQHIITLYDSQQQATLANNGNRLAASVNDLWAGTDSTSTPTGLAFGAPTSISHYIGNVGDGSSFLERLTATIKSFNVPVGIFNNLFVSGTASGLSFPFQPSVAGVTDNFSGSGALGSNWTVETSTGASWTKANNVASYVAGSDQYAFAFYTGASFSNNQIATAQCNMNTGGTSGCGAAVRGSGSATVETAYFCWAEENLTAFIFDVITGTPHSIASGASISGLHDFITCSANGTTISMYDNGVLLLTGTNSAIASGYPGIFGYNVFSSTVGNFSAGGTDQITTDNVTLGGAVTVSTESPNAGQAACFSTSGALGHCTSVVSSSGACTCVSP